MTSIIKSTYFNNLHTNYIFSKKYSRGAVILLDGMPSDPDSKKCLMGNISSNHFDVFFPTYEGTWQSKGTFLTSPPSKSIIEFVNQLYAGIKIHSNNYKTTKVFILGSSFGGGVGLDIAKYNLVDKVCVTSPVIKFKKVENIATLEDFMINAHRKNYHFNHEDWNALVNDRLWNLDHTSYKKPENILVIAGKKDNQVKSNDISDFCQKHHINIVWQSTSHITLSKIPPTTLRHILHFFSKQEISL